MKKTILAVSLIALVLSTAAVSAGIPNNQCYKLTSNIDNSVLNADPEHRGQIGPWLNPCTGTKMMYDSYANYYDAPYVSRKIFANGDVEGHRMNTRYVLCSDGRSRIENWALYYIKGMSWGVWFNHPLTDASNHYKMTQCNTL